MRALQRVRAESASVHASTLGALVSDAFCKKRNFERLATVQDASKTCVSVLGRLLASTSIFEAHTKAALSMALSAHEQELDNVHAKHRAAMLRSADEHEEHACAIRATASMTDHATALVLRGDLHALEEENAELWRENVELQRVHRVEAAALRATIGELQSDLGELRDELAAHAKAVGREQRDNAVLVQQSVRSERHAADELLKCSEVRLAQAHAAGNRWRREAIASETQMTSLHAQLTHELASERRLSAKLRAELQTASRQMAADSAHHHALLQVRLERHLVEERTMRAMHAPVAVDELAQRMRVPSAAWLPCGEPDGGRAVALAEQERGTRPDPSFPPARPHDPDRSRCAGDSLHRCKPAAAQRHAAHPSTLDVGSPPPGSQPKKAADQKETPCRPNSCTGASPGGRQGQQQRLSSFSPYLQSTSPYRLQRSLQRSSASFYAALSPSRHWQAAESPF